MFSPHSVLLAFALYPIVWDQPSDLPCSAIHSLPHDSSLVAQTLPPQFLCLKLQLWSCPQHHMFYLWFDFQAIFPWIWSRKVGIKNKGFKLYPSRFLSWLEQHRYDLPWPPVPPQFPIIERTQNNSLSGKERQRHTHQQSRQGHQRLKSTLFPPSFPTFNKNLPLRPHGGISFSRSPTLISWVHPIALIKWLWFAQFFCPAFEFFHVPWQKPGPSWGFLLPPKVPPTISFWTT